MITFIVQFCSALSLTKLSEIIVLGRLRLPKTIISEYRDTKNFYYKFFNCRLFNNNYLSL